MTGRWLDGARLAWGTLSAIPTCPPTRVDRDVAGAAMLLAPLTSLSLVAVWVAWAALARLVTAPPLVVGAITVTLLVLLTRAMHQDGLADYADGLSASYDRERALAVMKTGDVGPSGAAAIALCTLLQASSLASLATTWHGIALGAVALLVSRHLLAWACLRPVPSARPGGLGAMVAGTVPVAGAAAVLTLVGTVAISVSAATGPWWHGLVCVLVGLAACWLVVERAVRRLGGITGDVLGATIEIGLSVALVAGALLT